MRRPITITGLDIGSSRISAVVAEVNKDGVFTVLTEESSMSKGVWRGALIDLNDTIDSVSKVLLKIRNKTTTKDLGDIYVNITGDSLKGEKSKGMIPLALRGREITKADIDRCANVASTIQLPFDRDIIHRIVQKFSVDNQEWMKNPLGLYASRLACEVYIITANINHIQNIYKCVNDAGFDVKDIVFTGIAKGESLLEKKDNEGGLILLDIGASLTELSIFSGCVLSDMAVIPLGAQDFKDDFKNSIEFENMISRVRARIEDYYNRGGKPSLIKLAGGFSFADSIIEVLEDKLSYPVKMGIVKDIKGDISSLDSIRLAGAIGLARYAHRRYETKRSEDKGMIKQFSSKVVDMFNNYF